MFSQGIFLRVTFHVTRLRWCSLLASARIELLLTGCKGLKISSAAPVLPNWPTSSHTMFGKPCEHAFPSVLRLFLAIAGTIVGIEGVACVRVDMDLRFLILTR